MKFRKSIVKAVINLIPLWLWTIVIFIWLRLFQLYWWAVLFLCFSLLISAVEILDDYMDYIELKQNWILINLQKWIFRNDVMEFGYDDISSIRLNRTFLQALYFAWNIEITTEWKLFKINEISWAKICVKLINNKIW